MTRSIPTALVTALTQDAIQPFHAVEMNFDAGSIRLWTGYGNRTIEGNTYLGVGTLMGIAGIEEASDMSAKGITISLAASDPAIISLALTEPYQGRVANVYFGINPEAAQSNLTKIFSGYMDQMNIAEDADTATIELSIENKLIDLERPRTARFTSAYQKSVFPGDLGLDFVEDLQDKEIVWGRSAG